MPLIDSEPKGKASMLTFSIDTETKANLHEYCKFSNNKPDRIIREALKLLFRTDPEFAPWQQRQRQSAAAGSSKNPAEKSSEPSSAKASSGSASTSRSDEASRKQ
ncbi:MAG TPA: hypothetical protein VKZ53_08920 [Candidatus Angelobacter sp.]|nr:hypothetical protein [Candidatus Angelobacter sp.]